MDSNHRRLSRQIYSLLPLATRAPTLGSSEISLAGMPSFDVVSEVDMQEVRNAVDQAQREVSTRFDFKDTGSSIELSGQERRLPSSTEDRMKALTQVSEEKFARRQVSLKAIEYGKLEE